MRHFRRGREHRGEKTSAANIRHRRQRRGAATFTGVVISGGEKVSGTFTGVVSRGTRGGGEKASAVLVGTVEKTSARHSQKVSGHLGRRREDERGDFYRCREQSHQRGGEKTSAVLSPTVEKTSAGNSRDGHQRMREDGRARARYLGRGREDKHNNPLPAS